MHKKKWYITLFLLMVSLLQFNCSGCGNDNDDLNYPGDGEVSQQTTAVTYDRMAMQEVIQSMPAPVEMAAMVKDSKVPFSTKYLQNPKVVNDFASSFKKALGLGVLSADLGYLNVYGINSEIVEYLASIRKIAEDLKIGQFFDFSTLKYLATSNDNMDSLLIMCVQSYQNMEDYLSKNQRSNLSAAMVTGVWIESLYLLTQVAKERPSDDLRDNIGEQKFILNNLLPILKLFEKDDVNFQKLVQCFEELKDSFSAVDITVEVGEPETIESNGAFVVVQNDRSVVKMTSEELQEIIQTTERIRNKLIAL